METMVFYVRQLLGPAPPGLECLEYILAGSLGLMLCFAAVSLIAGIFRWIGGN